MSRTYTKKTIIDENINTADNFGQELDGSLQEFNGKLGQHNMPLRSVDGDNLVTATLYDVSPVIGSDGPANSYFRSEEDDGGPWVWDYTLGDWRIGWNPLFDKMGEAGSQLTFTAEEGILKGAAVVDCERRSHKITGTVEPITNVEFFIGNWFEVGVFVNDRLLARTGQVFVRRFTFDLPFATYIGNETVTVDVRWRAIDRQPDVGFVGYDIPPFRVYSSSLWARNQKR